MTAQANTDANGQYSIVVPSGDYYIFAYAGNVSTTIYVSEWYLGTDGTFDCNSAASISAPNSGINFSLAEGGSISGHVYNPSGGVITDATIRIHASPVDSSWGGEGTWVSQTDGSFTISGLLPGQYRVQANNNQSPPYLAEYYNDKLSWNNADFVTVTVGSETSINNIFLETGVTISGTVTDGSGGIQGVIVQVFSINVGKIVAAATTDQEGAFSISVPSGSYYILANAGHVSTIYVSEWWNGVGDTGLSIAIRLFL